ncbi:MAG: hypothetical protein ACREKE_02625 [bacterium]
MSARISELSAPLRWTFLVALAAASVLCLECGGSAQRSWRAFPPPLVRPLPPDLDWFSLTAGLGDSARPASDLDYIVCLQYMGGRNANDGFFGKTLPLYARVQWLAPGFRHAVIEGISALGWLYRRPEEAERLDRAAMAADPREARYGVFLAALAYQKHLDSAGVLRTLAPQVLRPDAPAMLRRVVGNLILKQGDWKQSYAYWLWLLQVTHDGETRAMAERTLPDIRRHLGLPPLEAPAASSGVATRH